MAKEQAKPAPVSPAAAPAAEKKAAAAKPAPKKKEKKGGPKPYKKLRNCPKCGAGVHLAEHPNRFACGRCGYMEKK